MTSFLKLRIRELLAFLHRLPTRATVQALTALKEEHSALLAKAAKCASDLAASEAAAASARHGAATADALLAAARGELAAKQAELAQFQTESVDAHEEAAAARCALLLSEQQTFQETAFSLACLR